MALGLIEKTLSADNLFVFMLLFGYFGVPPELQRRALFWGILGALVMRGALILLGAAVVTRFESVLYVFGGFLLYTGIKIGTTKQVEKVDPDRHPVVRLFKRVVPMTDDFRGPKFLVRDKGRLDFIPAIVAVTRDPFIVYSSNIFALLGLRSLYLVLVAAQARMRHLRPALAIILGFAGVKMLLHSVVEVPIALSLGVIVGTMAVAVVASLRKPGARRRPARV